MPPWPTLHPSHSSHSLAPHAASIPLPQSPKRRRVASISLQTKGLGSFGRHNVDLTDTSDIEGKTTTATATIALVQRSPKKKRRADQYPMPPPPPDTDDDDCEFARGPLFGATRVKGEEMSLDGIDVNDIMLSSQATTVVDDTDEPPRRIMSRRPPLRQREEFDMSLDDIHAGNQTDTEAEDGGELLLFSSQTTVVSEPTAPVTTAGRRGKVNLIVRPSSSSQATEPEKPTRSRAKPIATRGAAKKVVPAGGVVKSKSKAKSKAAPKAKSSVTSRLGSGSARNPISIEV